jgi:hypothetical protein
MTVAAQHHPLIAVLALGDVVAVHA